MAEVNVYFVHLRRPRNLNDQRADPFYEYGSFGCTGCHSKNLLHPRHAEKLNGARLAFVQGGNLGSRLVFLTPPITIRKWKNDEGTICEAKWTPRAMPFRYEEAPILVSNNGASHFKSVKKFAGGTRWGKKKLVQGLSSLIRSCATPLPPELAHEVVRTYKRMRARAPLTSFASTYDEALPWILKNPDRQRKRTYKRLVRRLGVNIGDGEDDLHTGASLRKAGARSCRRSSRCHRSAKRAKRSC